MIRILKNITTILGIFNVIICKTLSTNECDSNMTRPIMSTNCLHDREF